MPALPAATATSTAPTPAVTPPMTMAAAPPACSNLPAANARTPAPRIAGPGPFPLPPKAANPPNIMTGNETDSSAAPRAIAANPVAPRAAPTTIQRTPPAAGSVLESCTVSVMKSKTRMPESLALYGALNFLRRDLMSYFPPWLCDKRKRTRNQLIGIAPPISIITCFGRELSRGERGSG